MTAGTLGLEAGIEPGRRVHLLVAEDTAHDFVSAGLGIQIELRRDVAEEMQIDLEAGEPEHVLDDLLAERARRLRLAILGREQGGRKPRGQDQPMLIEIPLEERDAPLRQLELEVDRILDLACRDHEVALRSDANDVALNVESSEVLAPDRRHNQKLDPERNAGQDRRPLRCHPTLVDLSLDLLRQPQEAAHGRLIVEGAETIAVLPGEPQRRRAETSDDIAHLGQGGRVGREPVPGHAFKHGGHILKLR